MFEYKGMFLETKCIPILCDCRSLYYDTLKLQLFKV